VIHKNCRDAVVDFCEEKSDEDRKRRTINRSQSQKGRVARALSEVLDIVSEDLVIQDHRFQIACGSLCLVDVAITDSDLRLAAEYVRLDMHYLTKLSIGSSIANPITLAGTISLAGELLPYSRVRWPQLSACGPKPLRAGL
jgi:hypothetical protein